MDRLRLLREAITLRFLGLTPAMLEDEKIRFRIVF